MVSPATTASKKAGANDLTGFIELPDVLNRVYDREIGVGPSVDPVGLLCVEFQVEVRFLKCLMNLINVLWNLNVLFFVVFFKSNLIVHNNKIYKNITK